MKTYQAGQPQKTFVLLVEPGVVSFALPHSNGDAKDLVLYAEVISQMLTDLPLMQADMKKMEAV